MADKQRALDRLVEAVKELRAFTFQTPHVQDLIGVKRSSYGELLSALTAFEASEPVGSITQGRIQVNRNGATLQYETGCDDEQDYSLYARSRRP